MKKNREKTNDIELTERISHRSTVTIENESDRLISHLFVRSSVRIDFKRGSKDWFDSDHFFVIDFRALLRPLYGCRSNPFNVYVFDDFDAVF